MDWGICVALDLAELTIHLGPHRVQAQTQAPIEELVGKSTEGQLTETERAEYAGYVRANKFIAILHRQAQQLIGI